MNILWDFFLFLNDICIETCISHVKNCNILIYRVDTLCVVLCVLLLFRVHVVVAATVAAATLRTYIAITYLDLWTQLINCSGGQVLIHDSFFFQHLFFFFHSVISICSHNNHELLRLKCGKKKNRHGKRSTKNLCFIRVIDLFHAIKSVCTPRF